MTWINNSLEELQSIVDGHIEVVRIDCDTAIIVNEEGKIRNMEANFYMSTPHSMDIIVGTAIVVGTYGDEFVDCPLNMRGWKQILENWGNKI